MQNLPTIAGTAFVPRAARQYTDEQIVESILSAELSAIPAADVAAAKAEALKLVGQGRSLNSSILLATINAATSQLVGKRLVQP